MEGNSICSCIREIFEEAQREQVISSQFQDNPYSHLLPFSCLIINGAVMLDNTNRTHCPFLPSYLGVSAARWKIKLVCSVARDNFIAAKMQASGEARALVWPRLERRFERQSDTVF